MSTSSPDREIEGTLLIRSKEPASIADRFAALESLGKYHLIARDRRVLRDVYLDTSRDELASRRLALRLRDMDGTFFLALKADSKEADTATDRLEIEEPWSEATLDRIIGELERRGVSPPGLGEPMTGDPMRTLARRGLVVSQLRETLRLPWDVLAGLDSDPVAELALDSVSFPVGHATVRWREVEVEARDGGDARTVSAIIGALRERFGSELRPWRHSKLVTGRGLRRLADAGLLKGRLKPDGELQASAYLALEEYLEKEEAGPGPA